MVACRMCGLSLKAPGTCCRRRSSKQMAMATCDHDRERMAEESFMVPSPMAISLESRKRPPTAIGAFAPEGGLAAFMPVLLGEAKRQRSNCSPFQIFVKIPSGCTRTLDIPQEATIEQLLVALRSKSPECAVPMRCMRLYSSDGKCISGSRKDVFDRTVADYNIQRHSTATLVIDTYA